MEKIKDFTAEQWSQVDCIYTWWLEKITVTDPANRDVVDACVIEMYDLVGAGTPKIEWYDSPIGCLRAAKADGEANVFDMRWSAYWCSWVAHCQMGLQLIGDPPDPELDLLAKLSVNGHMWFFLEKKCYCSERPSILRLDDLGNLHCGTGPAMQYRDGYALYSWHGTEIPKEWTDGNLDPKIALTWDNIEQRRAAAEIVGWDKVLSSLSPTIIDQDSNPLIGTLLRVDLPGSPGEQFLRVRCGTGRDFVLGVPSNIGTAREAQLWLYPGIGERDLKGIVRT